MIFPLAYLFRDESDFSLLVLFQLARRILNVDVDSVEGGNDDFIRIDREVMLIGDNWLHLDFMFGRVFKSDLYRLTLA